MAKATAKIPAASNVKDEDFRLERLYQNPGAYEAKCDTVMLVPSLRIVEKKSGKTVEQLNNMRMVKHSGTMPDKISSEFFKMIEDEAIPAFVRSYQQAMAQAKKR